jgi:hypothetical protein
MELAGSEGRHAASGVVDQHDFPGAQLELADGQGADDVVGDRATRVA